MSTDTNDGRTTATLNGRHVKILDNAAGYQGGIGRVVSDVDTHVGVHIGNATIWVPKGDVQPGRFVDGSFVLDEVVVDEAWSTRDAAGLAEDLRMCQAPARPAAVNLEQVVGLAISDPGATTPRRLHEHVSQWAARAVLNALAEAGALVRSCRVCGCTDDRACLTETVAGEEPCHWVEQDRCSAPACQDGAA